MKVGGDGNPRTHNALVIMNPRNIPAAMEAFAALRVDEVCWLSRMTEARIQARWHEVMEEAHSRGVTHMSVISDDTVVTQAALDAVLDASHHFDGFATGWCNLQEHDDARVNLSDARLTDATPGSSSYAFPTVWDVLERPMLFQTFFTGMCLTTASIWHWGRFPFIAYEGSYASDYHLSYRLGQAEVDIAAVKPGYVRHLKSTWNQQDQTPEKRILVGIEPESIQWA